jgi:hypothetical protein
MGFFGEGGGVNFKAFLALITTTFAPLIEIYLSENFHTFSLSRSRETLETGWVSLKYFTGKANSFLLFFLLSLFL